MEKISGQTIFANQKEPKEKPASSPNKQTTQSLYAKINALQKAHNNNQWGQTRLINPPCSKENIFTINMEASQCISLINLIHS